jgi:hypothetical protein
VRAVLAGAGALAISIVGVGSYVLSPSPHRGRAVIAPTAVSYSAAEVGALRPRPDVDVLDPASFDPSTYDGVTPVAFPGDPSSAAARAYLASTARPTGAGYLAWLSANGYPKPGLRLVVAGPGDIVPGHAHHDRQGWLPRLPLVVIR